MAAIDPNKVIEHRSSEPESHIVVGKFSAQIGFQLDCVLGLAGDIVVGSGRMVEV